jgi:hydrogenase maturation protease
MDSAVVVGIGNDVMGDDAVGLIAARRLAVETAIRVVELPGAGWDILDAVEGYRRALIVDSVCTGHQPCGTIVHMSLTDFSLFPPYSPHWIRLPDAIAAARRLGLEVPDEIVIIGMEVENISTMRAGLSPVVERALEGFVMYAHAVLDYWHSQEDLFVSTAFRDDVFIRPSFSAMSKR